MVVVFNLEGTRINRDLWCEARATRGNSGWLGSVCGSSHSSVPPATTHANQKTKSTPSEKYAPGHRITVGLRSLVRSMQTHRLSFVVHNSRPCLDAGLPQRMSDQSEPARSMPRLSLSACGQRCATHSSFRSRELTPCEYLAANEGETTQTIN